MSSQLNIKLDHTLKKEADELAKQLGLSLSGVVRAFLLQFIRSRGITFSLDSTIDTSPSLDGKQLEKQLRRVGYSATYAKKHGKAYDAMLKAEQEGQCIEL